MNLTEHDHQQIEAIIADDNKRQALIDLLDNNPHAIEDIQNGDQAAVDFTVQGRLTAEEVALVGRIAENDDTMAAVLEQACDRTVQNDKAKGIRF